MTSAVSSPSERATPPLWLPSKVQAWNWPFPLCVPLSHTPQAKLQVPPWPAPAWVLAAFLEQGHIPAEPSFPRGQAHKRPLQLSPAALGEEASSWNPGAARDVSKDSASNCKTHLSSSLRGTTPKEGSQSQVGAAMCSRPHTREQRGVRPVRDSPAKKQASHRESNMCPNSRE